MNVDEKMKAGDKVFYIGSFYDLVDNEGVVVAMNDFGRMRDDYFDRQMIAVRFN